MPAAKPVVPALRVNPFTELVMKILVGPDNKAALAFAGEKVTYGALV